MYTLLKTTTQGRFTGTHSKNTEASINVLIQLKSAGLAEGTLRNISFCLAKISSHVNLENPEEVKLFIANLKVANSYKQNLCKAYNYYAKLRQINWYRPHYKHERKIPVIPTKENIMKVISASRKYATIFTVLMETGLMPKELEQVTLKDIDFDRRILSARGFKGHASRNFRLTKKTTAMLKAYFDKYKEFPESKWMGNLWRKHRNTVAKKLQDPSLKNIRLYDLRHFYATMLYAKTRDILLVKQQMGHKKIETTLLYTQLLAFNTEEEYTCKTATTVKEATLLLENGFQYVQDMDGIRIYRKRK